MRVATNAAEPLTMRLLGAGPEALRPDWLRQAWSGEFGRAGLRADVHDVSTQLGIGIGRLDGSATVAGTVARGDDQLGYFIRDVTLHRSGRLEVQHTTLELEPRGHRTGFARGFNDHAVERYRAAGVDDVTLDAGLTVGGYAWARQGFELAVEGATELERATARAAMLRSLVGKARHRLSPEQRGMLESRLLASDDIVRPGTLASVQELAKLGDAGRAVLLGSKWSGIRSLSPVSPWWARQGADAPAGVADAARAATALLPRAFDPLRALPVIEQRGSSAATALVRRADDSVVQTTVMGDVPTLVARHKFAVVDGRGQQVDTMEVAVRPTAGGTTAKLLQGARPVPQDVQVRLPDALRRLGVDDLEIHGQPRQQLR